MGALSYVLIIVLLIILLWYFDVRYAILLAVITSLLASYFIFNKYSGAYYKIVSTNLQCINQHGEPPSDDWNAYGTETACNLDKPTKFEDYIDDFVTNKKLDEPSTEDSLFVVSTIAAPSQKINGTQFNIWTTILSKILQNTGVKSNVFPTRIMSYLPLHDNIEAEEVKEWEKLLFGRDINEANRIVDFNPLQNYDNNNSLWIPNYVKNMPENAKHYLNKIHQNLMEIKRIDMIEITCPNCSGAGEINDVQCNLCSGRKTISLKESIKHSMMYDGVNVFNIVLASADVIIRHIGAIIIDHRVKKIFKIETQHINSSWGKNEIEYFFDFLLPEYKIITPSRLSCPNFKMKKGFQAVTGGWLCQIWSMYMSVLYILNPNIPVKKLYDKFSDITVATEKMLKFISYVKDILATIELPEGYKLSKRWDVEKLGMLWNKLDPQLYREYFESLTKIELLKEQFNQDASNLVSFSNDLIENFTKYNEGLISKGGYYSTVANDVDDIIRIIKYFSDFLPQAVRLGNAIEIFNRLNGMADEFLKTMEKRFDGIGDIGDGLEQYNSVRMDMLRQIDSIKILEERSMNIKNMR